MKDVKIVIGANYGDEGKGLMTRHFVLDTKAKDMNPIVIFSNGTAQRGHTVDYSADSRHVYHHFGSGTGDKAPTYFAKTFLIHPMEYHREYNELISQGITPPLSYFDADAKVITPFDMVVDHATEEWIAIEMVNVNLGLAVLEAGVPQKIEFLWAALLILLLIL